MSLTYFEDAEEQLMPKMFKHVSWENIKADILKAVDGYKGRQNRKIGKFIRF